IYIFPGCGKRENNLEDFSEPLTMDELTAITLGDDIESKPQPEVNPPLSGPDLESLPPLGPYKPTVRQIQRALSNAGHYAGDIDGVSGPMTEKAIKEFQEANNLKVDGKVGPNTWSALSRYTGSTTE
ncbi:MAG: peptidoglycan-binding domain-containing protein, partial [Candidatus Omnitrophota bacterium]